MLKRIDENVLLASPRFTKQKEYWTAKLTKDMPVTGIRSNTNQVNLGLQLEQEQTDICFPGPLATRLIEFSKKSDLSLYIILLTSVKLLIHFYTGNEDIGVLSPLYSPNINDVTINDCLIIHDRIYGSLSFIEFLLRVKKSVLDAYENQDFPFEKVMEHALVNDAAQVNGGLSSISCSLMNIHFERYIHSLDCKINFIFWREQNQIKGSLKYDHYMYSCDYAEQLVNHYIEILKNALENIHTKISDISFLSEEEKRRLIFSFNNTSAEYPRDKKIHQLFEEQVDKSPDHISLICREHGAWGREGSITPRSIVPLTNSAVSYRELSEQSDRLAYVLLTTGVKPDTTVGIMVERSVNMIVGILGILKSGGAYLPIDPEYPQERVDFMLKDSGAKLLITTNNKEIETLRRWKGEIYYIEEILCSSYPLTFLPSYLLNSSNLAYIIYTSGSTGRPKGVMVEHQSVVRLVKNAGYIQYSMRDRLLPTGSIAFDISTFELWSPLLNSFMLLLVSKEIILNPEMLKEVLVKYDISILHLIPQLFNQMAEQEIELFSGLHYFLVGGDLVKPWAVNKLYNMYPHLKIVQCYGPTENTTFSTTFRVDKNYDSRIPIGKPIANSCAFIVSKYNHLQPVGVPGELLVGGDGIALGYLNKPELTAEKFINFHHLSFSIHHSKLYRTGDLACRLPDGNIEFLGRIDCQVKIRGFRIELGEIENQLLKHESVKEVVVIERQEGDSDKYLCAYIVIKKMAEQALALNSKQLKGYLSQTLPDYMIPAHFVFLDKIPLNDNGKIDKKALPKPQIDNEIAGMYIAPRNEIENKMAGIWSEVLGIEKNIIGIDLNFFDLGGNSLKGTIVCARINKELNIKVPMAELFINPTIRALSAYAKSAESSKHAPILPTEKKDFYLLSSAQMRMYLLQQFDLGSIAYNMPQILILEEGICKEKLEIAFKHLIQRHESLRTSFLTMEGKPVQKIHEHVNFGIEQYEMNKKGDGGAADEIIKNFVRAFDLFHVPLLRVGIIDTYEKQHILMVDMHHIISDGMSQKILINDFMELFTGKELPPLRLQYKDYSEWQNYNLEKDELISQKEYWLNEFQEVIPLINLPADFPRPARQSFEGKSIGFEIGEENQKALNEMAQREGATIFMVLLAAYNIFLSKLSSQEDITVGTPVAGRKHSDLQMIIGILLNTLVFRNYPVGEKPFLSFLNEVKQCSLNAFENQDYPFENLVENLAIERDMSRNPLFDVMFIMENIFDASPNMPPQEMQDLTAKPYQFDNQTAKFDLSLYTIEKDQKLFFTFEYCTKLFKEETIKRLIRYFKKIITSITENPGKKISEIEMISNEEKNQILYNFNATSVDLPEYQTLPQIFEKQVYKVPDNIAIVGQSIWGLQESSILNAQITYRELDRKSGHLAYLLKENGIKSDVIVGIMLERCIEMIMGIMGILKAGGAYLPIDPGYPEERVNYMLKDSNAKILINKSKIPNPKSETNSNGQSTNVQSENRIPFVLDFENLKFSFFSCFEFRTPGLTPSNLAYIIYTSGSTGRPKGVMIEHYSAVNRLNWMQRFYPLDEDDVILQKTNVTFDVSVWELFWWFFSGASVCLLEAGGEKNPGAIIKAIEKSKVTTIHFVPSMFNVFLDYLETPGNVIHPVYLKRIFSSGEALKVDHVAKFNKFLHKTYKTELINLYGPTEATVDVSYYNCPGNNESEIIPIGKPLDNIQLYILDEYLHIQPVGIPGELYISGIGLGRGYLNRPELTIQKFLEVDEILFKNTTGCRRIYKTGDLARWLPNGNIEFLGRIDHQVKIRGFRIELEEIESQLMSYEKIKEAVVVVKEDDWGDPYLCAFIVGTDGAAFEEISGSLELREYLSGKLPTYMIPSYFVTLDKISLTANGKIDRKSLVVPEIKPGDNYIPPRNDIEKRLQDVWSIVLGIKKDVISMNSSFFELGGHSLKATILATKIYEKLNVTIPLALIFKTPRISGLAKIIIDAKKEFYQEILPVEKKEFYPQSSAQKRLFFLDQFENLGTSYNMPTVFNFNAELDIKRIENTFKKLIQRHEALRTSFTIIDQEWVQRIHDYVDFEVKVFAVDEDESKEENIQRIMNRFIRPFDLSRAPLLRFGLASFSAGQHILLFDMHHIITDGISQRILNEEFGRLFMGEQLAPLRIQYKDYSEWQADRKVKGDIQRQENYWLTEFEGEMPALNIPTDYPRPAIQSYEGHSIGFSLSKEETDALNEEARLEGATLFQLLLTALNILLYKLSNQEDIIVGVPIAGRRHADLEGIIGMFINTLALRNHPFGEKSFREFLREVKEKSLEAFENQDYQFEELVDKVGVERSLSRSPLFDVAFIFQNISTPTVGVSEAEIDGLKMKPLYVEGKTSKFDLTLDAIEADGKLHFVIEYCVKLFMEVTILKYINYFKTIISTIIECPEKKTADIEIITGEEKHRLLIEFNDTGTEYPRDRTIHQLFQEQSMLTPDHIAVMGDRLDVQHLTYKELNRKARQLAGILKNKGVIPDTIVAFVLDRSVNIIIGILGILSADGAYLPIDPNSPQERIGYMLKDSQTQILVTTHTLLQEMEILKNRGAIEYSKTVFLDSPEAFDLSSSRLHISSSSQPSNLAYIIYTSGSSGKPKGVMIRHGSVLNFIKGITDIIDFNPDVTILSLTTISFDIFGLESLLPLTRGSRVVMGGRQEQLDAGNAGREILKKRITILQVTPSRLRMQLSDEEGAASLKSLKSLLVGGETFPAELLDRAREAIGERGKIFNMYGPTETTIWSAVKDVSVGESLNIGKPIANTLIIILGKDEKLQPIGVLGELCIGGEGLARGYLNRPELTAEKFAHIVEQARLLPSFNHAVNNGHLKLYKTGDLARWLRDGNIEFIGRSDHQVKIRGFRIELGEIENQLLKHTGIKEAAVICHGEQYGDKFLCAYIVLMEIVEKTPDDSELREYLSLSLPDYMIPSYFIYLDKIPLTPNGKIDRKILPTPEIKAGEGDIAPRNKLEKMLAEIWGDVLRVERNVIGIDSNFFQLGGHSLNATVLTSKIHRVLNTRLTLVDVFKAPTIRGMARLLNELAKDEFEPIPPAAEKDYYALSSAQKRFYLLQQIEPGNIAFNMMETVVLEGPLDKDNLNHTFKKLIERHESLRTSFVMIEGEPFQVIHRDFEFEIEYFYGRGEGSENPQTIIAHFVRAFDLSRSPLLRVGLIKIEEYKHVLMVDIHHIIADGLSIRILIQEFQHLYHRAGTELPLVRRRYRDFSEWQNSEEKQNEMKKQENYWLNIFKKGTPELNLPTDFKRPDLQSFEGDIINFMITPEKTRKLKKIIEQEGATLFMMLLALCNIWLSRICNQEIIPVGTGVAGRNHPDLERMIGTFQNMVVLINEPVGANRFVDFLGDVKRRVLDAFENQDYPFEELVKRVAFHRDARRNPMFDFFFILNNMDFQKIEQPGGETAGLKIMQYAHNVKRTRFDLGLYGTNWGDSLSFTLEYCTRLFKKESIERFIGYFKEIVTAVTENFEIHLNDIKISYALSFGIDDHQQEDYLGFKF